MKPTFGGIPLAAGPKALRLLSALRIREATIRACRLGFALLVIAAATSWIGSLPIVWTIGGLIVLVGLTWLASWWKLSESSGLARELDRIARAEDRCATLLEPLPQGLAALIAKQLEICVNGARISWSRVPWRRVLLASLALGASWLGTSQGTGPEAPSATRLLEPGPSAQVAKQLRKAAQTLAEETADPDARELGRSLSSLSRLAASDRLDERQLEELRVEATRRIRDQLESNPSSKLVAQALRVLDGEAGASSSGRGEPREDDFTAESASASSSERAGPRDTASLPSSEQRTTWDSRHDPLVARYFEKR